MNYQVEVNGEAVASFRWLSWARNWADVYYVNGQGVEGLQLEVVIVDVITDDVLETWGV